MKAQSKQQIIPGPPAGIGLANEIGSLTCPGVQILDRDRGVAMATLANDQLAEACRKYPRRFTGLTAVAPQGIAEQVFGLT